MGIPGLHPGTDLLYAVDYDLSRVIGAQQYLPGYHGQARLLIDPHQRTIVGATFAGPGTAELLHSATIAITA